MKFGGKIYLGLVVIAATFIPLTLAAFLAVKRVVDEQTQFSEQKTESVVLTERLRHAVAVQYALMPIYVLSGDTSLIDRLENINQEILTLMGKLRAIDHDTGVEPLLDGVEATIQERRKLDVVGIKLKKDGAPIEKVDHYFSTQGGPLRDKMHKLLTELGDKTTANREAAKQHMHQVIRRVLLAQITLSVFALGLIGLAAYLMIGVIRNKEARDIEDGRISQSRKEVVEVVSHDLKNPLSSIKMSIELAMDQVRESKQQADPALNTALQIALRSANSMQRLITDLLDHAKIKSGHLIIERKPCDLAAFVRELLPRYEPLAKERDIKLIARIQETATSHCDQARIEQVLSNLLGNALKFTPKGGEIRIDVKEAKSGVQISIADTGAGINEEDLLHVFDRFWQKRGNARDGTGLGLSIAKAIVDAHQGEIWVESEVGKGSTFSMHLPNAWKPVLSEDAVHAVHI